MARLAGDNGKADDTSIKDILSPYPDDRSALTDCTKLLEAPVDCSKAILIYGFDWLPNKPIEPLIDEFEGVAATRVRLSDRVAYRFRDFVHPVHCQGCVYAWAITPK